MDTDEDESSIAELMDAVLNLTSRDTEAFAIALRYLPVDTLKVCRQINKTMHQSATKCLQNKTRVRLESVSSLQRYLQEVATMETIWENYFVILSSKLAVDTLLQFCTWYGQHVKHLELDLRYRDVNLSYLEDLLSEKLPNLEELTLKGKFPSGAKFINPNRLIGKLGKLKVFNLFAMNWHRLPPLPNGEVTFECPIIGQILSAMPNITTINYFPDVDSPRDAHRHYTSFLINLTESEHVTLRNLREIQHFTLSFMGVQCMEKFAAKGFPLRKLHILVEEEVLPEALCMFLETFRSTLTSLVIRSATENPIKWPRLLQLEELTLIGVNVEGTDFLTSFPYLKTLQISQDRVTNIDFTPERGLQTPHTLTCLKIVEAVGVSSGDRLTDTGLAILFRDLPYLIELAIIQSGDSTQPTFTDEGITASKLSISRAELSSRPRDLRVINRNLMRYSHFIGSLPELRKLTLKAPNITDISLLCGIVNCQRLCYLNISSPKITEKACIEMMDYMHVGRLRIQDFGDFTSAGKSEILVRMKFQEVFYAK